jgi:hypothetical protein
MKIEKLKEVWSQFDLDITQSIKDLNLVYQEGRMTKKKYEEEKKTIYYYYRGVKDFYDLATKDLVD